MQPLMHKLWGTQLEYLKTEGTPKVIPILYQWTNILLIDVTLMHNLIVKVRLSSLKDNLKSRSTMLISMKYNSIAITLGHKKVQWEILESNGTLLTKSIHNMSQPEPLNTSQLVELVLTQTCQVDITRENFRTFEKEGITTKTTQSSLLEGKVLQVLLMGQVL